MASKIQEIQGICKKDDLCVKKINLNKFLFSCILILCSVYSVSDSYCHMISGPVQCLKYTRNNQCMKTWHLHRTWKNRPTFCTNKHSKRNWIYSYSGLDKYNINFIKICVWNYSRKKGMVYQNVYISSIYYLD